MSDYEEMGENQTQTVSSEVQSLFAESRAILSDNNKPYDYYVPLSVQIEDEMWDDLFPEAKDELNEEENIEEDADDKDSSEITMPIGMNWVSLLFTSESETDYEDGSRGKYHFQASNCAHGKGYCMYFPCGYSNTLYSS